jgi:hypothetical protein
MGNVYGPLVFILISRFIWLPVGVWLIQYPPHDTSDIAGLIRFIDSEAKRRGKRLDWVDNKICSFRTLK